MSASSSATPGTASPASLTFRVDHVQDSSTTTSKTASDRRKARQGVLSFKHGSSATSHDTPTPAIVSYSKKGAPVHLSRDNVDRLPIEMVMLAYEHFIEYNPPAFLKAPFGLKRYLGLRHSPAGGTKPESSKNAQPHILFANLRDAADQTEIVGNTELNVACRSFRGVNRITSANFLNMAFPKPPDVLLALADEPIGHTSTEKRIQKSMTRSERFLLACLRKNSEEHVTNIFAPLVGGVYPAAREEYAKNIDASTSSTSSAAMFEAVAGYSLNLNTLRSPDHAGMASTSTSEAKTVELAAASFEHVDPKKPRLALCPNGPHEILALVASNGVDLFMDEWSSAMSSIGIALDFTFGSTIEGESDTGAKKELGINLFDDKYARDFSPLASPATMQKLETRYGSEALGDLPTKAYLHHLLQTHEMTSHVLLAMHNTCIMDLFAQSIREAIKNGTFYPAKEVFENAYSRRVSAWSEASAEWARVNRERGKGRLKGLGQERRSDGEATPPSEQERMSFDDPEDKVEKRLRTH
ncbi:tRNA-guanine transglycosylase [Cystobasidium minutum MCA 4210]|uniref:tRNA-guanine transglycosylase n=1 Tax=Cystobasidium minutum MCA 4210 TaxID=1397322 RepID=UPI0034CD4E87|eukprot:jgi/Rhomi1/197750/gm1.5964_g